ncbi:ubiquitin-associated (UBA)/TS-N domain-containing protein / octicosapeptide/Phox/Bemp1 (PB1) domain-containing protein [Euphorbia peplus]|nr:ubiquitin-associated (UBA)/TS-N domain-containing protein / octicosapeptide/Phox/Bemp1 (PB1) domain-containing protein [Euphorbia peplus]
MDSSMVIKVKFGDTLRRFNAQVNEDGQLDLDMNGLRAKVHGLFNIPLDADLALTYIDEDGDVVTLVDDGDLLDVMKQRLKFLKVNVHLNNDFAKSSGSSTPMISPRVQNQLPNINKTVADVLKSVPEPVRETLSKLSLDLASKATSSNCVISELVDCFSKMGHSILVPNQLSEVAPNTSTQAGAMDNPSASAVPTAPVSGATSMERLENVTRGVGVTVKSAPAPVDLNLPACDSNQSGTSMENFVPLRNVDDRKETVRVNSVHPGKKVGGVCPPSASNNSGRPSAFNNQCPFSYLPMGNDFSAQVPRVGLGRSTSRTDSIVGMFHRGVQCDGCGVHPITGPRYKSKVIDDYDLCSICFAQMGNEVDYIKMDKPMSYRHPRPFKSLHDSKILNNIPPLSTAMRHFGMRSVRPKLDSRFIMDVNVLDGTMMAPSTDFTKIWRMRNSGSVSWPQGARLVWIGGDKFCHEVSAELEIPVNGLPVDGELDVAVDFTSPELPGRYISYWRMASPSGTKFGQRVWVLIQVDASKKVSSSNGGLNLNLPPDCNSKSHEITDVNGPGLPVMDNDLLVPDYSTSAPVLEKPAAGVEQPEKDQDVNFPINNSLLVGEGASTSSPPENSSSHVSYPIIDLSEALGLSKAPATDVPSSSSGDAAAKGEDTVEKSLLLELEQMGFKQVDLNKEVLRLNEYNLEQSVDDLCGVSEWDPILEELQEMGFSDESKNKELLKKNNGSIRRVVMDLLNGGDKA